MTISHHTFASRDQFQLWKGEEEEKAQANYVQTSSTKASGETTHTYYYCNRSGACKAKGEGKRLPKSQGSCKLGEYCTSHMKVKESSIGVVVEYCQTHHNHDVQLRHLRVPGSVRASVAAKLEAGVPITKILDEIRDSVPSLGREHLITRQDVLNVKRACNIEGVQKHTNDQTSVRAWVCEMAELPYNPVVVFKAQGDKQGDTMDNIADDDFLLGIQTEFQCDLLRQFGAEAVCMDSTHGTNHYDFYLTTLLIVDEWGEGVPVAWLVSNHETTTVLVEFLRAVKGRCGPITPRVFMSDDADAFFTAWVGVFGGQGHTRKLLCAWHIDRSWRKAISKHVNAFQCYHVMIERTRHTACI